MQQTEYSLLYYVFILVFGVYCAMKMTCGSFSRKAWRLFGILCPTLLLAQGVLLELLGMDWVWWLYPLIVHLPIVLTLILFLHVKWTSALLSVIISYSLCQVMRWAGLVVNLFFQTPMAVSIVHLSLCVILLFLLDRYCLPPLYEVLHRTGRLFYVFGALPALYYLYEYFMIYTQRRFADVQAFQELLPTAMLLFFTLFTIAFQRESEKRRLAEQQRFILEMKLDYAGREVSILRAVEDQTSIYRHDMRHHLGMISSLLDAGQPGQATEYIRNMISRIESIVPRRYCENNTVNLLLGTFEKKAADMGVSLAIKASLPAQLCLNDTELCVILSNGLENALNAVAALPETEKREIGVFLGIGRSKLLIEIRNPYAGSVILQDGLPVAQDQKQHYGCRSILSVVQQRNGICSFETEDGVFLLQIAIPLS